MWYLAKKLRVRYLWINKEKTFLILSFAVIADSWFIATMAIVAFILLAIRLPDEEAHLIEKFGDEYRVYMKSTGAFLPHFEKR